MEEVKSSGEYTMEDYPRSASTREGSTQLDCWRACINDAESLDNEFKCASDCGGFD